MTTIQHLHIAYEHIHSKGEVYPHLANPVELTSGGAAWELGAITEVIPVSTITKPFDIHFCIVCNISANDNYHLQLYSGPGGTEVEICDVAFCRTAAQSQEGAIPTLTIINNANLRISGTLACAGGGAKTCDIKLFYHVY